MSVQITVLKVLAGHRKGRACVADLTRHVSILMSCGSEWTDRTKRLAARAPQLDIFGSAYVLREDCGWRITDIGRRFLDSLEASSSATHSEEGQREADAAVAPQTPTPVQPVLRLVVDNTLTAQHGRRHGQERRTA